MEDKQPDINQSQEDVNLSNTKVYSGTKEYPLDRDIFIALLVIIMVGVLSTVFSLTQGPAGIGAAYLGIFSLFASIPLSFGYGIFSFIKILDSYSKSDKPVRRHIDGILIAIIWPFLIFFWYIS